MKHIKFHILWWAISILFLTCCTGSKDLAQKTMGIPSSYNESKDSLNTGIMVWRDFFTDPFLENLIDTAIKNNKDLLIALQRIQTSGSNVLLKRGMMLPTVNAVASAGLSRYGLYTMDGAGNISTEITPGQIVPIHLPDYYTGFQTSWEADIWGKLKNRKSAAIAHYLASIEGRNWAITSLIAELTSSYYELLSLDNELEIVKETISLQEDAFNVVTIQKRAGAANELAVEQFEAQLLSSQKLEVELLQQITETENRINFLSGRFPQPISRDKSIFMPGAFTQINTGIPSDLLRNRPDIREAEFELIASKANVKAARAAFYPSLNITGSLGFQAFNLAYFLETPESIAYRIFGNLTAPLLNRSAIKADFNSAKAYQLETLYRYQKNILNGYVEVYNEIVRIKNLEQIYSLQNRQVEVLARSNETSSKLFKTGRANYLELLMTQRNSLYSRLELVQVKKRQYNSRIDLYKALGGGWR